MTIRTLIRDGNEADIAACLSLDHTYETDTVWQMTLGPATETDGRSFAFRAERLPRTVEFVQQTSDIRLHESLSAERCFLIAATQTTNGPQTPTARPLTDHQDSADDLHADDNSEEGAAPPPEPTPKETLIGYLTMRLDRSHRIALIQDLLIGRPYRRNHFGSRLLRVAQEWASEHDAVQLLLETETHNVPAIRFCQARGFTFCGFNDQYYRNQDIAVFFGKPLRQERFHS